jgi:DNA-binding GntR family transcriptional regulator
LVVLENKALSTLFFTQQQNEARAFVAQMVTPEALYIFDMIGLIDAGVASQLLADATCEACSSVRATCAGILKALKPETYAEVNVQSPFRK